MKQHTLIPNKTYKLKTLPQWDIQCQTKSTIKVFKNKSEVNEWIFNNLTQKGVDFIHESNTYINKIDKKNYYYSGIFYCKNQYNWYDYEKYTLVVDPFNNIKLDLIEDSSYNPSREV